MFFSQPFFSSCPAALLLLVFHIRLLLPILSSCYPTETLLPLMLLSPVTFSLIPSPHGHPLPLVPPLLPLLPFLCVSPAYITSTCSSSHNPPPLFHLLSSSSLCPSPYVFCFIHKTISHPSFSLISFMLIPLSFLFFPKIQNLDQAI